jgi:hypothetical protein
MTTLDPHGMIAPYKINRELSEDEKRLHIGVKSVASTKPHYELSLTQLNSTYVECVDKWYSMRGFVAMVGVAFLAFGLFAFTNIVFLLIKKFDFLLSIINLAFLAISLVGLYTLTRDIFTYTHYPIRFNRQNKQVYVFRRNGTVLKAAWEEIYWTIYGHGVGFRDVYVMGHIMGDDKKTVKESFALSLVTSPDAIGEQDLKDHFEFFRRYMQEGPSAVLEAIKPTPLIMLPGIYKQRESWRFGWERLTLNLNGLLILQILFQAFIFPMSLFRYLAMRTSKIPQWPQWVLDECKIEENDPWVRDERHAALTSK